MGVLVIPAAVLALLLSPFGLEAVGLWIMGGGLAWILWVSETVAGLDGARGYVPGPGPWVLPLIALGALFVILWRGPARFGGVVLIVGALTLWHQGARPEVLIADTGALVGVMTPQGRALSKEKGAGFVARNWLENDGDGVDQTKAAQRWDKDARDIVHLSGKRALAGFTGCNPGQIVIVNGVIEQEVADAPCLLLDQSTLRKTGAVAVIGQGDKARLITARDRAGDRMWSGWTKYTKPALTLDPQTRHIARQSQ